MEGYNARQMNLSCPSPNLELFPFPVMVAGSTPPNPFPPPSVVVATLVVVIAPPNLSPLLDVEASPIDGRPEVVLLSGLLIVDRPPMGLISERPLLPPTCTLYNLYTHTCTCVHKKGAVYLATLLLCPPMQAKYCICTAFSTCTCTVQDGSHRDVQCTCTCTCCKAPQLSCGGCGFH